MEVQVEEGWYTDPYGRHEARWMSAGTPARLVAQLGQQGAPIGERLLEGEEH
jgi:hypothetical protein